MDKANVKTLGALFFWNVEQFQFERLLTWKDGNNNVNYSTAEFESAVLRLAKWLRLGLNRGDRIAIYAENRPEWHIVDFAAHLAQMVLVPVYPTLSAHQMEYILRHAGARVIFCGPGQMERLQSVRAELPDLEHVVALDASDGAENLSALLLGFSPLRPEERATFRERVFAEDPEAMATIVYTSGTTGSPKGVMLSHRNIVFDALASIKKLPDDRRVRLALSALPLSHVLERLLCYGYLYRGIPIAYGDPHDLRNLLALYHPAIMGAVPRILEKMREAIQATIAKMPAYRRRISQFLLNCGYDRMDGRKTLRSALRPLAELLMFRKVRLQMGNLEAFVCGGAWLNPELERYFRALGFVVIQGYGLTETSPVVTCNQYGAERVGSVGQPIEGVEIRIDEQGEILVRGPNVMQGYFREPEATAQVFREGWLATGDLGHIDQGGFLVITGRRKEMLVLSNGKNIYYAPIEQALCASPFIEHAFVVGEGRNYIALIIVPNQTGVLRLASERGILVRSASELLLSAPILEVFRESVDSLQAGFSRFEQAKRFCFLPEEALLDVDLVTPSLKVRRSILERKYANSIDRIYQRDEPFVIPVR